MAVRDELWLWRQYCGEFGGELWLFAVSYGFKWWLMSMIVNGKLRSWMVRYGDANTENLRLRVVMTIGDCGRSCRGCDGDGGANEAWAA